MDLVIFVFLAALSKVSAQIPYLGSCPDVKVMEDFDVNQYMGKWYEAERYFSVFEFGGKCVLLNYTNGIDSSINMINQQISTITGVESKLEGKVSKSAKTQSPAQLSLRYPYLPMDTPYWVLDTDYKNYSVVWSCSNFGILSTRNAWILTREREPMVEVMEKAYSVIDRNFISRAYFIRTDQKNCAETH